MVSKPGFQRPGQSSTVLIMSRYSQPSESVIYFFECMSGNVVMLGNGRWGGGMGVGHDAKFNGGSCGIGV